MIGCLGPISFICGIVAIIVGAVARKKSRKTTGTMGMVMGIIGVSISVICVACVVLMMGGVFGTQLADYTQKAKASQDLMFCDTIRAAITTTMIDPAVVTDADSIEFEVQNGISVRVSIPGTDIEVQ